MKGRWKLSFTRVSHRNIPAALILLFLLAAGCTALPSLPLAQNRLVFQGQVISLTGEPADDRLVVAFLNGREVGRAITRCAGIRCTFTLAAIWLDQAGQAPAPVDLGQIPEGESRSYEVPGLPGEPGRRTYVIQVLAGDKDTLPPEFLSGKLGMLPDGQVLVISAGARPAQGPQWPPRIPVERTVIALLLVSCCAGLVAVLAGVAFVILIARWLSTTAPERSNR